jgi:DNA-binding GntR family transcriptional regulator
LYIKYYINVAKRIQSLIELSVEFTQPAALTDRIHATLKHRILTCAMRPGERIVEKDLCKEMAVSRTPLREALNRLALEGLVTITPYRGYATSPISVKQFRDLCEVRRIIESESAALAAKRATAASVTALRRVAELTYTRGAAQTYEGYLRANSAFHHELVQSTGNSLLETLVMSSLDHHQRPLYLGLDVGLDAEAATAEHLQVVVAVAAKDASLARQLMSRHIAHAEDRIVSALKAAGY